MAWQILVDWENNNNFSGTYDNITADVISIRWRLGMRQAFQSVCDESALTLEVANSTGKYLPENSSSPIYPYLKPHRRIKVLWDTATLYVGWIDKITIDARPAGENTGRLPAQISAVGAKQALQDLTLSLQLYENINGDVIVADVLRRGQVPPSVADVWRIGEVGASQIGINTRVGSLTDFATIETGQTTFRYYGDVQRKGWEIIKEVTEAERGRFFFDREGKAIWWNRHHLLKDITNDNILTLADPIQIEYNVGLITNVIKIESNPRQVAGSQVLWSLDSPITIPAGNTIEIEVQLRRSDGTFTGSGALSTSGTAFSSGSATITVSSRGGVARLTLANAGGEDATLTALNINGAPISNQNKLVVIAQDAASIAEFGSNELRLSLLAIDNYAQAAQIAQFELARRKNVRWEISQIKYTAAADGIGNAQPLAYTIGTRLRLNLAALGHDQDYFVIGEEHFIERGLMLHQATLHLEPSNATKFWMIGTAGYGEIGNTTKVGY
jgi:hypothetical protein